MTDPQHPQGDLPMPIRGEPSRRKRVVAREVDADEIEHREGSQPLEAAAVVPVPEPERPPSFESDAVLVIPSAPDEEVRAEPPETTPVLDPTLLGKRHRRSRHHRVYRWTQMLTMLSGLAAGVSLLCTMLGESLVGRILAGIAIGFGMIAIFLSARTSLSMRWRGWAVAATVFALVALGMTWIHDTFTEREGEGAPPSIRAKG